MYNSVITDKCIFYMQYIVANNLTDKIFDPNRKSTYTLDNYLHTYFLFQKSGVSYEIFYEIFNYAASLGTNNYPKRTALNTFKTKLADLNIHNLIHTEHIKTDKLITDVLLLDSVTVFNKCNSSQTGSFTYKNKKAIKVSHITNDTSYPLFVSVDPGNMNDAIIGYDILKDNIAQIKDKNVTVLADKGYDSNNIRDLLIDNNCSSYIPKNIRNANSEEMKIIKNHETDLAQTRRKELMERQKTIRKQKNLKKKQIEIIRKNKKKSNSNCNDINQINLVELEKIIKEYDNQLKTIKNERKEIPVKLKEKLKIEKIKDRNKNDVNECACTNNTNLRECIFCKTNKMCNKCNICRKCKKNLKYYSGLKDDQIIKYGKRIKVEHFISHYKHGRTMDVKDKSIKMLLDTIYNRYTDFIFLKKRRSDQLTIKCV